MRPTSTPRHLRPLLAMLATAALLLGACSSDDDDVATGGTTTTAPEGTTSSTVEQGPAGELAAARARWADARIEDYSMTYQPLCFCPQQVLTVTVEAGVIADVAVDGDDTFVPDGQTVEDMFDEIGAAIDGGAASVDATYDETDGHPLRYFIDESEQMADEEHGNEVLELAPAGAAPSTSVTSTSTSTSTTVSTSAPASSTTTVAATPGEGLAAGGGGLTETWGCYESFQVSDARQTVGLVITPSDPSVVVAGATGMIGDTTWNGELRLGTNLFANWCDDVLGPDEPRPQVSETWPVVAGSVSVNTAPTGPGASGCRVEPASIQLDGVVAVRPDGTSVELGNLSITNDNWGCVPG